MTKKEVFFFFRGGKACAWEEAEESGSSLYCRDVQTQQQACVTIGKKREKK